MIQTERQPDQCGFDVQKGWSSKGCEVVLENIAGDQDHGDCITSGSKLDLRATVVLIISCNHSIYFVAYNFRQFVFAKMRDCFLPSASIVAHPPMSSMHRDWFCWNSSMEMMVIDEEDSARTWTCYARHSACRNPDTLITGRPVSAKPVTPWQSASDRSSSN